ncbi:hypothetical protein JW979_08930 [bacterium]|nr:hypothetical protein [candidate division CSSED10-310 bacterium]
MEKLVYTQTQEKLLCGSNVELQQMDLMEEHWLDSYCSGDCITCRQSIWCTIHPGVLLFDALRSNR